MTAGPPDPATEAAAEGLIVKTRAALGVLGWIPPARAPGELAATEMCRHLGMLRFLVNLYATGLGPDGEVLVAEWADWAAREWDRGVSSAG